MTLFSLFHDLLILVCFQSYNGSLTCPFCSFLFLFSWYNEQGQRKKIAYPFKLVKSGGIEGETTLKDINNQILTTPSASKPIPHPVKDSVTNPCKLVRESIGLSGKEVASLTRIHTRGRGSITIIRTKD